MKTKTIISLFLLIIIMNTGCSKKPDNTSGKFVIVGMGTADDLITLRGMRAIQEAELIILQNDEERDIWKSLIRNKEIWMSPHSARIMYGVDIKTIKNPQVKKKAEFYAQIRHNTLNKIMDAINAGKTVALLLSGDAMIYGTTYHLELLPPEVQTEIIPGIGSFQCATAAIKKSPTFGYNTSSVILTMADWPGREDINQRLMALNTSLIVYTMHLDYPGFFKKLNRHYPPSTPVAVVCYAGSREKQKIIESTTGRFLKDVDYNNLPPEEHLLLVGNFIKTGQARKDGLKHGSRFIENRHKTGLN